MAHKKYTLTILVTVIAVCAIAVTGAASVAIYGSANTSPTTITVIIGFSTTVVVSLFTLLKAEKNQETLKQTGDIVEQTAPKVDEIKHEITEIKDRIHTRDDVEKIVRETIHQQGLTFSSEQLETVVKRIVEETFSEFGHSHKFDDFANQIHQIKHAVKNMANFMGLEAEVKRLSGRDGK